MHPRGIPPLFWALVLGAILAVPTQAQVEEADLTLSLRKDFGFRMGDRIQGKFTLEASGPQDLERVEFLLDGQVIGVAEDGPFRFSFSTRQFSLGRHTLGATGRTSAGDVLHSRVRSFEFVSAEESWKSVAGIAVPLIIGMALLMVLAAAAPGILGGRRGGFQWGRYGASGGAVCPRCTLPYSRHWMALNLVGRKLERCPHCGKWALVRRASPWELQVAEAKYGAGESATGAASEGEPDHLRRRIDDSRYQDG